MTTITALSGNQEVQQAQKTASGTKNTTQNLFAPVNAPATQPVTNKTLWNENTRAILYNIVKNTGIASYTPTLLKDDNTAIKSK